jgi:hypothetical protein
MGIQQSKISAVNIHLPLFIHMGVPFDALPMDFTFAAATSHGARQRTMIHWHHSSHRSSNP